MFSSVIPSNIQYNNYVIDHEKCNDLPVDKCIAILNMYIASYVFNNQNIQVTSKTNS